LQAAAFIAGNGRNAWYFAAIGSNQPVPIAQKTSGFAA
jgi:hypothetical protein